MTTDANDSGVESNIENIQVAEINGPAATSLYDIELTSPGISVYIFLIQ